MIKIGTYCEAYYNADIPLGEEDIVLTLLGENNAPSVATGLGVGESAAESKFMLIHCTVTTAIPLSWGPSVAIV